MKDERCWLTVNLKRHCVSTGCRDLCKVHKLKKGCDKFDLMLNHCTLGGREPFVLVGGILRVPHVVHRRVGYAVGTTNPALFFSKQRNWRSAVFGDDCYFLANSNRSRQHSVGIQNKVSESHRLGFGKHCSRAAVALNRMIALRASGGRRFVEPDTRHVELISKSLGLLKSSNAVVAPRTRHTRLSS